MNVNHIMKDYTFLLNDFDPMHQIMQVGEMVGVEIIA